MKSKIIQEAEDFNTKIDHSSSYNLFFHLHVTFPDYFELQLYYMTHNYVRQPHRIESDIHLHIRLTISENDSIDKWIG